MLKTIGIALCCAGALLAQGGPEKVTVPLDDPSSPAHVQVHLMNGSITVRGSNINHVLVENRSPGREEHRMPRPARAEGMKRLDMGNAGLNVTEENNLVNIQAGIWNSPGNLTITVPLHSSLQLRSMSGGNIDVENVDGEIDATELSGNITLKNISGSVVAHSLNGQILATLDRIDPSKPSSFSTLNGDIDVTLPANAKATLRMKTDNGAIYSDFDVKLTSGPSVTRTSPEQVRNGKYSVRFDRTVRGTINGGGPEIQFTTFNGQIYIRKAK